MSTIQSSRSTFADWLTVPGCDRSPAFNLKSRPGMCWSGLVALLLCFLSSDTVRAQDPRSERSSEGAPIDSVAEPASELIRRDSLGDQSFDGVKIVSNKMSIDLTERFSKVLEFHERLLRVDGHDPQVLDVSPLEPNKLRVRGVAQGVTTMIVTDANRQMFVIEVYVSGDARLLQSVLKRAFPDSAIQCQALKNDTILLTGYVTDNQTITQIMDVSRTYAANVINHMKVGGPQEVQLRVKIIEVQRSKLRTFGINFKALTSSAVIASTPGPITPISGLINPIGGAPSLTLTPTSSNAPSLTAGFNGGHFAFDLFLQALKEEGLLKVFTEPVVVTRSGEPARLSDGGEFPIPVPGGLGTVTIEFREFGVILETLPIVISPTRVKQQVSAEVSEKDVSNAITLNGTTVPGITKRKVQSTVDMNFGDTMVLGGLISTRTIETRFKTPFLGEIPGIGAAFSKKVSQQSETEMIILITPEFGSSMSPEQIPPGGPGTSTTVPTDRELYGMGLMEVPKIGSDCGPDYRSNGPHRFQGGNFPLDPAVPAVPIITPSPLAPLPYTPLPEGLIAPPGARSPETIPPAPSGDPSVSRRSLNGSSWPIRSRATTAAKSKDAGPAADADSVRAVGFRRAAKPEQRSEKRPIEERRADRDWPE